MGTGHSIPTPGQLTPAGVALSQPPGLGTWRDAWTGSIPTRLPSARLAIAVAGRRN